MADAALLLEWANDPETRTASFHPAPIGQATHEAWLAGRIVDSAGRLWIGLVDGVPVGQVRVDREPGGSGVVGIAVAPERRGEGLSKPLLVAGLDAARDELAVGTFVAYVRPENRRSLALFASAGFVDAGTTDIAGIPCLVLRREPPAAR